MHHVGQTAVAAHEGGIAWLKQQMRAVQKEVVQQHLKAGASAPGLQLLLFYPL